MATIADPYSVSTLDWDKNQRATPMQALVSFGTALVIVFLAAQLGDYRSIPDWIGYERLYINDGGWLLESGRDPAFTTLLSAALRTFGSNGYEAFRSSLILYFVAIIGYLCWTSPRQRHLSPAASAVLIGLIAAAMFSMKALVQIREGLAFSALMFAVIVTIRYQWRYSTAIVLPLIVLAVLTHSGLLIPATFLVGSRLLAYSVNSENKIDYRLHRIVLMSCISFGFLVAVLMIRNPDTARLYFEGYVSERTDIGAAALGKYIYWAVMGICCFIIQREALAVDSHTLSRYGVACVYVLSSMMLPICFAIAFGLIAFGFPDGTVIASFGRLLFTAMSLVALMIIILKGARAPLFVVSIFLLIDQVRIMLDNN